MATATSFATPFVTGGVAQSKKHSLQTDKLKYLNGYPSKVVVPQNSKLTKHRPNLSVHAKYSDGTRDGSSDFIAGFVLGGAIFGTLAYVFAPEIRRSVLNEDEYGFRRASRPTYFDGGLEKTRQTLNAKISQLNNAIDNVSSQLSGAKNAKKMVVEPIEDDSEIDAV